MITEDYVSFQVAKLLKEKGFDENCSRSYVNDKLAVSQGFNNSYYTMMYSDDCYRPISAPTLQMAMKWLREVHGIHITISPLSFEDGIFWMYKAIKLWSDNSCSELHRSDSRVGFNTYEEAVEAAIRYTLENLI